MEWTKCLKELKELFLLEEREWEDCYRGKESLAEYLADIAHGYIYENFGLDPDPYSFGWLETVAPQLAHFGLLSPSEERLMDLYNIDRYATRELMTKMVETR